jgi:predicted Ser/Thr protein kinase
MTQSTLILPPGAKLGGFEIEDVLGIGGMAIVYRALQTSLSRRVALKVLNPRLAADSTFRERFRREGALVAALDHPNVIPVYDSGEADGRLYLAMRLVDGVTLSDRMAQGLSPEETLPLIHAVAAALDAAHSTGLLHRDVKPQNILIAHTGQVYLADFGVAKAAGASELTRTGGFLGSVSYVSPEQIRGEAVGPAADVYALATVAYECFVGQTPFRRDTEAGVIQGHLADPPPRLQPAGDRWSNALSDAIDAGLAKHPADRPQTAGDFAASLEQALRGAPSALVSRRPGFPPGGAGDDAAADVGPVDLHGLDAHGAGAAVLLGQDGQARAVEGGNAVPASNIGLAAGGALGDVTDAPGRRAASEPEPLPAVASSAAAAPAPIPRSEPTIHDRRRSEFIPETTTRTRADRFFAAAPWVALAVAIVVPIVVLATTGKEPQKLVTAGPAETVPVTAKGWTSVPAVVAVPVRGTPTQLEITKQGRAWRSPDRKASVLIAPLRPGTRVSPISLGDKEQVRQLEVAGGTARQWSLQDTRVVIAVSEGGPVLVQCIGNAKSMGTVCDTTLGSLRATKGKLAAEPIADEQSALKAALDAPAKVRATTRLPSKDRATRARRAKVIAKAYAASAGSIEKLAASRRWDPDLADLQREQKRIASAYTQLASAATAKDRPKDAAARDRIRDADGDVVTLRSRFARRGYALGR